MMTLGLQPCNGASKAETQDPSTLPANAGAGVHERVYLTRLTLPAENWFGASGSEKYAEDIRNLFNEAERKPIRMQEGSRKWKRSHPNSYKPKNPARKKGRKIFASFERRGDRTIT